MGGLLGSQANPPNGSTAGWLNCFKALMEGITLINWINSMSIKLNQMEEIEEDTMKNIV
jgi:hypothetical protein